MAGLLSVEETRDLLVPTHLYYDVGSQSLRTRAIGEILTKILFLKTNKKAKFSELSGEAAKIVGVPRLDDHDVRTGLEFLKSQGAVTKQTSGWTLSDEVVQRVERDLNNTRVRIDHILDKHFGSAFDRPTLTKWFKAASAVFFGEYGEIWAHRLKRQPCSLPSAEVLTNKLKRTLVEFHLEKESVALNEGFESFLRDYADPLVDQQIWSFAQSMLRVRSGTVAGGYTTSIDTFRQSIMGCLTTFWPPKSAGLDSQSRYSASGMESSPNT